MICWNLRGKTWVLHHILIEFNLKMKTWTKNKSKLPLWPYFFFFFFFLVFILTGKVGFKSDVFFWNTDKYHLNYKVNWWGYLHYLKIYSRRKTTGNMLEMNNWCPKLPTLLLSSYLWELQTSNICHRKPLSSYWWLKMVISVFPQKPLI